ncbi:MAG: hypothetical protein K6F77_01740 [Lachnospiraceae bacterium]|nr:hypothetical protein [Lachnospiraceae bacterium]
MKEVDSSEVVVSKGHPVLAILLGILGILISLVLCIVLGVPGGVVSGVLGLLAIIIGASAKPKKGIGGIVTGVIAIILALVMTGASVAMISLLHSNAEKSGNAPHVLKYTEKTTNGIYGIFSAATKDNFSTDDLQKELQTVTKQQ